MVKVGLMSFAAPKIARTKVEVSPLGVTDNEDKTYFENSV